MTDVRELFRRANQQFGEKVATIRDDQWNHPTPCSEWNVRDLVNHLVSENEWIPPLMEGKTIAEVGDSLDGDRLGDDPRSAWTRAMEAASTAVDAVDLDRIVHLSFADVPASEYARQVFTDLAIHGWDLARGIGADESMDPELVEIIYDEMAPQEEELKGSGLYGAKVEVPAGADTQTRLLAITGRRA